MSKQEKRRVASTVPTWPTSHQVLFHITHSTTAAASVHQLHVRPSALLHLRRVGGLVGWRRRLWWGGTTWVEDRGAQTSRPAVSPPPPLTLNFCAHARLPLPSGFTTQGASRPPTLQPIHIWRPQTANDNRYFKHLRQSMFHRLLVSVDASPRFE